MIVVNASKMDKTDVKGSSLHRKCSEEDTERRTNSVSLENVEKLTIRTKNGLVNGVADGKCKSSKKHAKSSISANPLKETKKSKKGYPSNVQNNDVNISYTDISMKTKGFQKSSSKTEPSNAKNCLTNNEISKKSEVELLSFSTKSINSTKEDLSMDPSQSKSSQSESKSDEPSTNKTETKRKKNKSKLSKTEQNLQIEQHDFNLPKFDITSIINATVNNEDLLSKIPETPSTSQFDVNKPHLLECQDDSSEFEKDLIESIRNLKMQEESASVDSKNIGNASTSTTDPIAATALQEEDLYDVTYVQYESELQMPMIMRIIQKDLSEPYSIYTYRYFIHNWPKLCFLAMCEEKCVGAIVCKLDFHRKSTKRGYIAMLAVDKDYRKRRIGSTLVRRAIKQMIGGGADEVVLETEVTNKPALRLYEQLGFVRDKRLFRYYLNGVDALRLKLWLR